MTLTGSGEVGIGTASPGETLQVHNQMNNYVSVSAPTGRETGIQFYDSTTLTSKWKIYKPTTSSDLSFKDDNNTIRVTYKNNGRVGIGTTNPTRTLDLTSSGQITFGDNVTNSWSSYRGIYWHSGDGYGIYRTGGEWSGDYAQLKISFRTGIILDPSGGENNKSHVGVVGGMAVGQNYYSENSGPIASAASWNNGMIVEGNVGIGTTSPGTKLHINTSGESNYLRVSAESSYQTALQFYDTTNSNSKWIIYKPGSSSDLRFYANSTSHVTFKNNGLVGIGTTSPGTKLHVDGKLCITGDADNFNSEQTQLIFSRYGRSIDRHHYISTKTYNTTGGNFMKFNIDDGSTTNGTSHINPLTLTGAGRVGIGTDSPDYNLELSSSDDTIMGIVGGNGNTHNDAEIRLLEGANDYGFSLQYHGSDSNLFRILGRNHTSGTTTHLTIHRATGNVGIGTSSQSEKLDIRGDNTRVNIYGNSTSDIARIRISANNNNTNAPLVYLTADGDAGLCSLNSRYDYDLTIQTNNNERMRIKNDGKVGIGTTSPDAGLEVTASKTITSADNDDNYFLITTLEPTDSAYNPWLGEGTSGVMSLRNLSKSQDGSDLDIRIEVDTNHGTHKRYYRGFPFNHCFNISSTSNGAVSNTAATSFNGSDWTTVRTDFQIHRNNGNWEWSFTRSNSGGNYDTNTQAKYNDWPNQSTAHVDYDNVGLLVHRHTTNTNHPMGKIYLGGDPENEYTTGLDYESGQTNYWTELRVYAKRTSNSAATIGIKSSYAIVSNTYLAVSSDRRIKNEIIDSSNNEALEKIRNIPSRTYHYVDNERRQIEKTIGFIAQEVKEVIPTAVTLVNSFIPDQQRFITNFEWTTVTDSSNIILSSDEFTDISNGRYRFYLSNTDNYKEKTVEVDMNSDNTFTFDASYSSVYMYGKEVYDYNMLNKEKIFALHHPAIQELDQQQQADKARIAELETQLSSVLARLAALESA